MKRFDYKEIFFWVIGILLLTGCEERDVMVYEGVDGIYFDVQYGAAHGNENLWARQNFTHVSFGTLEETEVDVTMKIGIAGSIKDYDRPFRVEIVRDSSNAIPEEEYTNFTEDQVIKAGENHTYVTVRILKSERMADDTVRIQFRIDPGEHFTLPFAELGEIPGRWNDVKTGYSSNADATIHNVFANNLLQLPAGWGGTQYFGKFSPAKYQYLMDISGYSKAHFEQLGAMTQGGRAQKIKRLAVTDLQNKFNLGYARLQKGDADGWEEWVLDEGGKMMWVPGITWWNEDTLPDELVKKYYKPQEN